MADTKAQQEPSMEEILASIRRIIAEDHDPAAAAPTAEAPPVPAPAPPPFITPSPLIAEPLEDDDILELTNLVAEEIPAVPPARPPLVEEPSPRFRVDMEPPPAPRFNPVDDDRLLSAAAASASAAAFSSMSSQLNRRRSGGDMMMGNSGLTLEEIVRDELRPLLRTWLDANLPGLVERLVREELERVTRDAF